MSKTTLTPPSDVLVGRRLREARERVRLPQWRAQQALNGMSRPTFIAIEYGRRGATPDEIITLCNLYGCQVSEIMGGTADRLGESDPLGMVAEVLEWVRRFERSDVSEGQLAAFLRLDRIACRGLVQSVKAMAAVIAGQVSPNGVEAKQ